MAPRDWECGELSKIWVEADSLGQIWGWNHRGEPFTGTLREGTAVRETWGQCRRWRWHLGHHELEPLPAHLVSMAEGQEGADPSEP